MNSIIFNGRVQEFWRNVGDLWVIGILDMILYPILVKNLFVKVVYFNCIYKEEDTFKTSTEKISILITYYYDR